MNFKLEDKVYALEIDLNQLYENKEIYVLGLYMLKLIYV